MRLMEGFMCSVNPVKSRTPPVSDELRQYGTCLLEIPETPDTGIYEQ